MNQARALPRLEPGDRLTGEEFHRRYSMYPEGFKAELIDGEVYVGEPTSSSDHGEPHGMLNAWLGVYAAYHSHVRLSIEPTVNLDPNNGVQPDAVLFWTNA